MWSSKRSGTYSGYVVSPRRHCPGNILKEEAKRSNKLCFQAVFNLSDFPVCWAGVQVLSLKKFSLVLLATTASYLGFIHFGVLYGCHRRKGSHRLNQPKMVQGHCSKLCLQVFHNGDGLLPLLIERILLGDIQYRVSDSHRPVCRNWRAP